MNVGLLKEILDDYGDHVEVVIVVEKEIDEHEIEDFDVEYLRSRVELICHIP